MNDMEELFSIMATVWEGELFGMQEAGPFHDILEDSITKASEFFRPVESVSHKDGTSILLEDYSFEQDSLYSHANLSSIGIAGHDALDMMLAHEGTNLAIQEMDIDFSKSQKDLCSDFMVGVRAGLNGIEPSLLENLLMQEALEFGNGMSEENRLTAIEEGMEFARDYMEFHSEEPNFSECFNHFCESLSGSMAEIAELQDMKYGIECTLQHYRDLLGNVEMNVASMEEYEDAIRKYFVASIENARMTDMIAFKSRESMVPYEEYPYYKHPELNPFGIYAMFHPSEIHLESYEKPYLPDDFLDRPHKESQKLLQEACNAMCDAASIRHIKVILTSDPEIRNAAQNSGFLPFTLIDDTLFLNRDYARASIAHFGNTDSLLVDMAHEIGHSLVMLHCGMLKQKTNETLADILSTLITSMMGIDVDVARQYFLWSYDGKGNWAYKSSEGRWDASCVGRFWYEISTLDSFLIAMQDRHFRDIAYDYDTESREAVNEMVVRELDYQMNEAGKFNDNLTKCLDNVLRYLPIPRR